MVDIDGVISLFGVPEKDDEGDGAPRGSLHAVDGTVHFLSVTAAAHLLGLAERVRARVGQRLGGAGRRTPAAAAGAAGGLPHLSFDREPGNSGAHWKLEAIERFARGRALAWVDDCFNDACRRWAAARESPTLLVAADSAGGSTGRRDRAAAGVGDRRAGAAGDGRSRGECHRRSARRGWRGGRRFGQPRRDRFGDRGPVDAGAGEQRP